ncbi:MAG: hypothetical protein SFT93_04940 [Rickettsiaceae bacterium]|nr:hypothetical protein [Rickettsiaceae bacterium]
MLLIELAKEILRNTDELHEHVKSCISQNHELIKINQELIKENSILKKEREDALREVERCLNVIKNITDDNGNDSSENK